MRGFVAAIALVGLVVFAQGAAAASYGDSPDACAMGPRAAESYGKVDGLYLDDDQIIGWEWGCDFEPMDDWGTRTGRCSGAGEQWTETLKFSGDNDTVTVTFEDGRSVTLDRCPE